MKTLLSFALYILILNAEVIARQVIGEHIYYFPPYLEIKTSADIQCDIPENALHAIYFQRAQSSTLKFHTNKYTITVNLVHDNSSPAERQTRHVNYEYGHGYPAIAGYKTLRSKENNDLIYFNFAPEGYYYSVAFKTTNEFPSNDFRAQFLAGITLHDPEYFDRLAGYPLSPKSNLDSLMEVRKAFIQTFSGHKGALSVLNFFDLTNLFPANDKSIYINSGFCLADYHQGFTWKKFDMAIQQDVQGNYTRDEFFSYHLSADSTSAMAFVKSFIRRNYISWKGHLLWNKFFPEAFQASLPPEPVTYGATENSGFFLIPNFTQSSYSYIYKKKKSWYVKDHVIEHSALQIPTRNIAPMVGIPDVADVSCWYSSDTLSRINDKSKIRLLDLKTGTNDLLTQLPLPRSNVELLIELRYPLPFEENSKPDHWLPVYPENQTMDSLEFQLIDFSNKTPRVDFAFECYTNLNKRFPREKSNIISPWFHSDYDQNGLTEIWRVSIKNKVVTVLCCFEDSEKGYRNKKVDADLYAYIVEHVWVKHWMQESLKENLEFLWPPVATNTDKLLVKKATVEDMFIPTEAPQYYAKLPGDLVDIAPAYPGGINGLMRDLTELNGSPMSDDSGVVGKCVFIVTKYGNINDIHFQPKSTLSPEKKKAIQHALYNLPYRFEPGQSGGKPVDVQCTLWLH